MTLTTVKPALAFARARAGGEAQYYCQATQRATTYYAQETKIDRRELEQCPGRPRPDTDESVRSDADTQTLLP